MDSVNPNKWTRLKDIVAVKPKTKDLEFWLLRALRNMQFRGEEQAAELLKELESAGHE
jgi:hypothetical protein